MATVALLTRERNGPIPRREWTHEEARLAHQAVRAAIAGVGLPETDKTEEGDITAIIRRQCTDQERRRVLEKYLSI